MTSVQLEMPISPAPSHNRELLQHGLEQIVQHNASSPFPQERYHSDEGLHLHSNYSSPTPGHDDGYGYRAPQPRYSYQQHQQHDSGLGIHYEHFTPEYQGPIYQDYGTPASSPPKSMSNQDVMRTRSGYAIPRTHQALKPMPEGRSRSDKSPKLKKAKKEKSKPEKKVAKLEKPLSELTKDWTHVPVADIEAYVNRSAEERVREVNEGKIPGKVKRPMNSFMLYRKAYQNRTKDWCLQNNHQVVSQVCGDSWPLEPDEVKDKFNEWARVERQNHQNAHPGYKFSPTKPGATKGPSKRKSSRDDSEESDLDDFDWQAGGSKRAKRIKASPHPQLPVAYPTTRSAYHYSSRDNSVEPHYVSHPKFASSFHAQNPGQPMPPQYNTASLNHGEYYQQTIHAHPKMPSVQDVIIRKAMTPGVHSFLGLPGGGHEYDNMMSHYPQHYDSASGGEYKYDHAMGSQEQPAHTGGPYGEHPEGVFFGGSHNGDGHWHGQYAGDQHQGDPPANSHFLDPELENIQDQHAHVLRGTQEGWHAESLDAGEGAFDKWMDGPE